MIRKILYVHYQRSERDGSYVHTREFETAFSAICRGQNIDFKVISPVLVEHVAHPHSTAWGRFKHRLARYYLRDIKLFFQQTVRAWQEYQMLRQERPDMVLTRFDGKTLSILWACRWLKIPAVIEINGPDRDEEANTYRHLPGIAALFNNRHAMTLAQGAFAVSDVLADPLRQVSRGKPVATIANGVDPARFNPQHSGQALRLQLGIAKDAQVIGFVGSFAPWHGLDLLVEAFSRLQAEFPQAHLLLVGQANPQWQKLLDRLRSPALAGQVTLAGFVRPAEIPGYLAVMDITTLPNTAYYCSPLKLFEYMAMARPTVSVATAPVTATLQDGVEGLLFPENQVDALTSALRRLLADPALRIRLGLAARLRIEREYTWQHNAQQVFTLLAQAYEVWR